MVITMIIGMEIKPIPSLRPISMDIKISDVRMSKIANGATTSKNLQLGSTSFSLAILPK